MLLAPSKLRILPTLPASHMLRMLCVLCVLCVLSPSLPSALLMLHWGLEPPEQRIVPSSLPARIPVLLPDLGAADELDGSTLLLPSCAGATLKR